jgi:hypothetical protein
LATQDTYKERNWKREEKEKREALYRKASVHEEGRNSAKLVIVSGSTMLKRDEYPEGKSSRGYPALM